MISKDKWTDFQMGLNDLSDSSTAREILEVILSWLRAHPEVSNGENFRIYGFDKFLKVEEEWLPVDESKLIGGEFINFRRNIIKYGHRDESKIAMRLRDAIESLILLSADMKCPRCGHEEKKIFKRCEDGVLVFVCGQCGLTTNREGERTDGRNVDFARYADLKDGGYL